jgi:hypothetical protein
MPTHTIAPTLPMASGEQITERVVLRATHGDLERPHAIAQLRASL